MQINFIYDPLVSLEQMIGYEMAAIIWGQLFTDDIRVNILAKTTDQLDANVIGGAIPEFHEQHYGLFLQYFEADITSAEDQLAYDALQQGNTVDFLLNGDLISGNTKLKLTTALAKALGMDEAISLDRYTLDESTHLFDGTIMMNQDFTWDFNYLRDSAAAENTLDFLSVSLHETGHILGFTSSLDFSLQQDTLYSGRTELSNFSPLDLFRFSAESLALENPDGQVNDLSIGGVAWFSTDGGETLAAKMSTGKEGDGYQASHWERRYDPLGIMDPTLWYQERVAISDLDVLAFDIMGYDLASDAGEVEQLFTTEGLELVLAQAKVQLADKLGVAVEWIEENANVPVSSLDLIAEMEATTTDTTTTDTTTTDTTTTETTPDFIKDLDNMMKDIYQWWSQNGGKKGSSWQELYEWWAQNNGRKGSSWQELYEWWWQNNGRKGSSWQELYEWWAQHSGKKGSSWQELYEWWAQDKGNKGSWWQEVFFASQDRGNINLEEIQLPGQSDPETIYKSIQEITGNNQDEIIGGDITKDLILAGVGDDLIDSAEGDDTVIGGEGNDTIFGFDGNDSIMGGEGDDVISGESDKDALFGQEGDDVLMGGDHDDHLDGGEGRDFLSGNTGHDALVGGAGDDALEGEAGKDLLVGGEGQDIGNGGSGDDFIFGDRYSESLKQSFGDNLTNLTSLFTLNTEENTSAETANIEPHLYSTLDPDTTATDTTNTSNGNDTLTFQQGINGYNSTVDTQIEQDNPDRDNSTRTTLTVDGGSDVTQVLIRFEDIFGIQADRIGSDHTINSAFLEINVTDRGPAIEVYEILQNWSDTDTWNSWNNGIQTNGIESANTPISNITSDVEKGIFRIDVTASLQTWQDNPDTNYGWALFLDHSNRVDFDSAESSNAPRLVVDVETQGNDNPTGDGDNHTLINTNHILLGNNSDILKGGNGNDGIDGGEGNDVIFGEDELNDSSNIAPINIAGSFNYGHSTYLLSQAGTWAEVQAEAQSYGGNLVTINDAAENQWLLDTFGVNNNWLWIGLTDQNQEGQFEWISGQEVTHTNWAPGQPYDDGGNQNYAILNWNNQGWDDNQGTWQWQGIIEIDWSSIGGNDTVFGGSGDDQIYGNSGNDRLYGDDTSNFNTAEIADTPKTLTFQQGMNGYSGTVDTQLHGYYETTNYGDATSLNVDGSDHGYPVQSLIKFENIFGSQTSQIDRNATINSAILEIDVSDPGSSFKVHELLKNWSDSSTWSSWNNGVSTNDIEAATNVVATTGSVSTGILQIDVTESLKAWQANSNSNYGWVLIATGSNGVDFGSSESTNAPRLVVDITQKASALISGEGNDNITGNGGNDTISGGAGDDVINGTDEIVAGYWEKDVLIGGIGADTFILGDIDRAYYATVGYQDYAVIEDFDSSLDKIQLYGSAIDYQQQQQGNNIFLSRSGDLVAILKNTSTVNLNGSGIQYVGVI